MNNLPLQLDIIVRQGAAFTLPYQLIEEFWDDETGELWEAPWDTSGKTARFVIKPVIAGEVQLGAAVIDITHTATEDGQVVLGINGPPGFESSVFVWVPSSKTLDLTPWSLGFYTTWVDNVVIGEGTARLQRT